MFNKQKQKVMQKGIHFYNSFYHHPLFTERRFLRRMEDGENSRVTLENAINAIPVSIDVEDKFFDICKFLEREIINPILFFCQEILKTLSSDDCPKNLKSFNGIIPQGVKNIKEQLDTYNLDQLDIKFNQETQLHSDQQHIAYFLNKLEELRSFIDQLNNALNSISPFVRFVDKSFFQMGKELHSNLQRVLKFIAEYQNKESQFLTSPSSLKLSAFLTEFAPAEQILLSRTQTACQVRNLFTTSLEELSSTEQRAALTILAQDSWGALSQGKTINEIRRFTQNLGALLENLEVSQQNNVLTDVALLSARSQIEALLQEAIACLPN